MTASGVPPEPTSKKPLKGATRFDRSIVFGTLSATTGVVIGAVGICLAIDPSRVPSVWVVNPLFCISPLIVAGIAAVGLTLGSRVWFLPREHRSRWIWGRILWILGLVLVVAGLVLYLRGWGLFIVNNYGQLRM